ncbi:hypothetical protein PCANC_09710 [Puccinia coronata f. sp. avenae]|uniref:RING-type domain-containing protein n=1 Tax=Puccinia coronata f. sp. avenae TaxID=200324 RepID=A0A2N5V7R9_9BASI|nr:hypothetical protein PCANC_09710 [Puccinia coronata f. sp. avenae]
MNANPNPRDLPDDIPGRSSPGGARPVEEPAVPQPPLPPSPTSDQEQGEALKAPHAEPLDEGNVIELPEEQNDAIAELFARVNNGLDEFSDGMFIDIEGNQIVGMGGADFNPAREEGLMALIRHLEAMPENHPELIQSFHRPTWEEVMQTLNPETQAVFRTFYDDMRRLLTELTVNPTRNFSDAEIPGHPVDPDNMQRALPNLDPATAQLIADHLEEVRLEINEASRTRTRVAASQEMGESATTHCPVCLDNYGKNDNAAVLPCHPSHHFHRACIQSWLQGLIPKPLTCPICRGLVL